MEHFFELPVSFNGEQLALNGRMVTFGYTYKFYITIDSQEFIFERGDEMAYRMLLPEFLLIKMPKKELIQAVIASLESLSD